MVHFGTSGWRGIIAGEFTFDNVRRVTQAIAAYLNKSADESARAQCGVIVGYDTRFLSEKFAATASEVLAANGIKTFLSKRSVPTPVIAYEILRRGIDGAVNFTASHNPPEYNGIKFSPAWGGPALPETTRAIEKYTESLAGKKIKALPLDEARRQKLVDDVDLRPAYLKRIKELVNLRAIRKANLKIAADVLYGTGNGYLDKLFAAADIKLRVLHNWRDVLFAGRSPEPSEGNLGELVEVVKKESCHLGLATDGDADRFGIIDADGTFVTPNQTIALLLYHLVTTRQWTGVVARSVMTTGLVDRIAGKFGVEVRETPVGFKYIGEIMVKEGNDFIIGGEESGGLTIRGHVPEKDGILACLLVAEMVAMSRKPIGKILAEMEKLVGRVYSERFNFHLTPEAMEEFRRSLAKELPGAFAGIRVDNVNTIDGYKFLLADGSWLGLRLSGTEPVVRLYLETGSPDTMKKLIIAGKRFIKA